LHARLIAVALLALLPIAVLLGFLWLGARERDRDDTLSSLTQVSQAVAVIADDLFDEGITLGQALATDPAITSLDPALFVPRLRQIEAGAPSLANVVVIDAGGDILGWAETDPLPVPPPNVASRPFFQRVAASQRPTTMRMVNSAEEVVLGVGVAVPILDGDGALRGVVAIRFDPGHVVSRLGQIGLFPGQVLSLIDPNGRVANRVGDPARSIRTMTWEQRDRASLPEVRAALAGQSVATPDYRSPLSPPTDESRLAAFVPTPRHGWVVSTTWPAGEAFGSTRRAQQRELGIFLAIVLVIVGGSLVASRSLIAPMRRLASAVRALGDGPFEPITVVRSNDEVGDLAASINEMGTRLQRTLDDLHHERARLATILQHLPVGVVIRSAPDGALVYANPQAERLWGRPLMGVRDAETDAVHTILGQDGRPYTPDRWPVRRALADGEEVRGEQITITRTDGSRSQVVVSAAPIRDDDGQIVAAVASFDDVTEHRETESRLRAREEMLRALVDQFPGAVAVLDRDLRYVLAAGRQIVGPDRPRHELVGLRAPDLYALSSNPAGDTARYERAFAGETVTFDTAVEGKAIRVTVTPLRDMDGDVEHVLNVSFDVTEEREQLERLAHEEKLHALGQMAGGIAHNLNQTLALVTGYGEMARDALEHQPTDVDELRRMLRIVERAAYDGGETVKRLLTFSRGKENERRQAIDVAALLHEVGQLTAPRWRDSSRIEGRPVDLHVQADPGLLVIGSQAGLREALINLVFNALDAMPNGGTVTLAARAEGESVVLDVRDSGTGMTPEIRRRIFEPFFTTKGENGTGLGLAMVFGIVRHHHGRIDVTTAPGQGTTMQLTLPAGSPAEIAPAADDPEQQSRSLRVLVVDDEARLAALAAGMLRRDGHQTTEACSGQEAIERLRAQPFDLVISDLSMGDGMNGWELAAETGRMSPGLPVVLATGWGAAIDEEEANRRGVRAVLAKPYRIAELRETVARALAS
jgi:PAS domain S-box-containing protein